MAQLSKRPVTQLRHKDQAEKDLWQEYANGNISAWLRSLAQEEIDRLRALDLEQKGRQEERARIVKKASPQPAVNCKHEGFEHLPFCYRCQTRR